MKQSSFLFFILLLSSQAEMQGQQFNKGGRTAFQFVKIGVGARQSALGEACISSVRDINSVFWNPAGISGITTASASFSYAQWFADLQHVSAAAGVHWDGIGTFALSFASLDYGDIPEAIVSSSGGSSDTRTNSTFTGGDLLVGFTYSRNFTDQLSIGGTVKLLQEKLHTYSVDVMAFDLGTYFETGFKGIRLAMAAQNFAGSVKWLELSDREEGYDIPLIFRIGTSVDLVNSGESFFDFGEYHRLTVSMDAIHTNDYAERLHLGGEYLFSDFLSIRSGYKFNYEEGNLSFGLGLRQNFSGVEMSVDYSYVNFEYLESPHRLTVSFGF